jgi:hypothetical protein
LVKWWLAGENRSSRRKPAPVPLFPPQIPHTCPEANPGRRGEKPATNRLSYGTAVWLQVELILKEDGSADSSLSVVSSRHFHESACVQESFLKLVVAIYSGLDSLIGLCTCDAEPQAIKQLWKYANVSDEHVTAVVRGKKNKPCQKRACCFTGLHGVTSHKRAAPQLRRLVAGFPPRRPGFKPGSGHVGFCDGQKWRWGRFSSENFGFPCQSTFHLLLHKIIFTITRGWHNRPGVAAVPIASQTK